MSEAEPAAETISDVNQNPVYPTSHDIINVKPKNGNTEVLNPGHGWPVKTPCNESLWLSSKCAKHGRFAHEGDKPATFR